MDKRREQKKKRKTCLVSNARLTGAPTWPFYSVPFRAWLRERERPHLTVAIGNSHRDGVSEILPIRVEPSEVGWNPM